MGRLLRKYWHPIAYQREVQHEGSVVKVTLLSEKLILFRTLDGHLGLVAEACPHRGASLAYGIPERGGIRCAYHGWTFNTVGACIDRPFERDRLRGPATTSYRVCERAGLVFAYLGKDHEAPALPCWELLARERGYIQFHEHAVLDANWLLLQENAADVTHTHYLHGIYSRQLGLPDTTGFSRKFTAYGFMRFQYGLLKTWRYAGSTAPTFGWGNLLVFPNILYLQSEMHWRVPVDENRTRIFILEHVEDDDPDRARLNSYRRHFHEIRAADGSYLMSNPFSQDAMAVESQSESRSWEMERLGQSDRGIAIFRAMLAEAVAAQVEGRPIINVFAPTSHEIIDLRPFFGGDSATTSRHDSSLFSDPQKSFETIKNASYEEHALA